MVIEFGQIYFVTVGWSFDLINVEVDRVVVWESEEHALDPLVFKDKRQIFTCLGQFEAEFESEVIARDLLQLSDRYKSDSLQQEDLSLGN
jgi:hypothetical protein